MGVDRYPLPHVKFFGLWIWILYQKRYCGNLLFLFYHYRSVRSSPPNILAYPRQQWNRRKTERGWFTLWQFHYRAATRLLCLETFHDAQFSWEKKRTLWKDPTHAQRAASLPPFLVHHWETHYASYAHDVSRVKAVFCSHCTDPSNFKFCRNGWDFVEVPVWSQDLGRCLVVRRKQSLF